MKPPQISAPKRPTDETKAKGHDRKRSYVLWIPIALLLAGPTPGAVGSCNQNKEDNRLLDLDGGLQSYCQEKEQLICWRLGLRNELDSEEVVTCRLEAIRICETRFWSQDCRPTQRQADACLRALSSHDTLETEESEISECSEETLCKVKIEVPKKSRSDGGDKP